MIKLFGTEGKKKIMNDTQVRHFIELGKCLNFTRAARNLYIAQPALSRSIAKLEKELGFSLFVRSKKNVRLTPAGVVMMEGYQKLIQNHRSLLERAIKVGKGESGSLNVGIIECQNTEFYLPKIIEIFHENYQGIKIGIFHETFKSLRQKLEDGEADIIITQLFDLNAYESETIAYEVFADILGGCIVSKKHPLAKYEEVYAEILDGQTVIVISKEVSSQGYDDAINYFKYNNINGGEIRQALTLQDVMLQVEAGLGFSFWDCNAKIDTDFVKLLPIKDHTNTLSLVAVWRKENYNTAIPIFIDALLKTTNFISRN